MSPHEFFESDLRRAHGPSIRHFAELWRSGLCGCFGCLDVFEFKDIRKWTDGGQTALCPNCGIDSVIGDASGFPITEEFLAAMEARWFGLRSPDAEPGAAPGPRGHVALSRCVTRRAPAAGELVRSAAEAEVRHGAWHVARRGPGRRSAGP